MVQLIFGDLQQHPPINRIKTPMHCSILQLAVNVTDELLGRKRSETFSTLDAPRIFARVQFRGAKTPGFPETLVINTESEGTFPRSHAYRDLPVEQGATQSFRIGFCDKSATGSTARKDALVLENIQLLWSTPRTVNLEAIALVVDLYQRKVLQHRVEYLGQTKPLLATYDEARDRLPFEDGLCTFTASGVRGSKYRQLLNGQRRGLQEFTVVLGIR